MTTLNKTLNPINAQERVKINQNWDRIMQRLSSLQDQINILSGENSVEDILNALNAAISNANSTVQGLVDTSNQSIANVNQKITEVDGKLVELQTAIDNANLATNATNSAISDARQAIADINTYFENFRFVGEYNATTTYRNFNFVRYQKSTFVSLKENLGITPNDDGINWRLVAAGGIDGQGAVNTVNNLEPDSNGNVRLPIENVQNFGIATLEEAEAGMSSTSYMTPERTKQAMRLLEFKESLATTIKPIYSGSVPAQQNGRFMQSICYIPQENAIIVVYGEFGNDVLTDLVKFSLEDYSVLEYKPDLTLYHGNDITYNPITNELIVVTLSSPNGGNELAILDYPTLTVKRTVLVDGITNIAGIAYNSSKDFYVAFTNLDIAILNNDFEVQSTNRIKRYPNFTFQCAESVDDLVYLYWNHLVQVFDFEGKLVREWYLPVNNEAEGIAYIGNGDFLIGQIASPAYRYNPRVFKFNIHEEFNASEWTTQYSLRDLGVVEGSEDIGAIAISMSERSIFEYVKKPTNTSSAYPTSEGVMRATKHNANLINFEFWDTAANLWTGIYDRTKTPAWTGWLISTFEMPNPSYAGSLDDIDKTSLVYSASIPSNPVPNNSFYVMTLVRSSLKDTYRKQIAYSATRGGNGVQQGNDIYVREMINGPYSPWSKVLVAAQGVGSPEGVALGPIGSVYINTSGGANTTLYIKTSGTGNTGWTAK